MPLAQPEPRRALWQAGPKRVPKIPVPGVHACMQPLPWLDYSKSDSTVIARIIFHPLDDLSRPRDRKFPDYSEMQPAVQKGFMTRTYRGLQTQGSPWLVWQQKRWIPLSIVTRNWIWPKEGTSCSVGTQNTQLAWSAVLGDAKQRTQLNWYCWTASQQWHKDNT